MEPACMKRFCGGRKQSPVTRKKRTLREGSQVYQILTDSTADLPIEYLKEHDIGCIPISYILDDVTYGGDRELDWKEFYAMMRD